MAARDAESATARQLAFALTPARARYNLLDAFRQAIALHPQAIHRDRWRLQKISFANCRRVHSDRRSELIELRLKSETHVHGAVPAHRAAGRLVGKHTVAVVADVGNVIERAEKRAGIKNGHHAIRTVSAAILNYFCRHRGNTAVFCHSGLQVHDRARTSAVRPKHFLARIRNFHRRFRFAGGHGRRDLQRNHFALAAEAAADQRLDHPDLRHRQIEHDAQLVLQVVGHLRRRPHDKTAGISRLRINFKRGKRGVRLHRRVRDFVGNIAAFDHLVGFRKAGVRIAEDVVIILFDVVRARLVDQVGFRLHGFFGVEPRGQEFIFDVNQLKRILGDAFRLGDDAGNVVAHVADFFHRECGFVVTHGQNAVFVRCVFAGHHRDDAGQRQRAGCVNFLDTRMRVGRMQNLADQHARQAQVIGVLAEPGGLARGIHHGDRLADYGKLAHVDASPSCSAVMAALTA